MIHSIPYFSKFLIIFFSAELSLITVGKFTCYLLFWLVFFIHKCTVSSNLIKIGCSLYLWRYLISNDIPYGGHVRVHIFNRPMRNEPTKSCGAWTEDMPRAVWHTIGWSKMNERIDDMKTNRMLLVLPKNIKEIRIQ